MRTYKPHQADAAAAVEALRAYHTNRLMPTGEQVRALRTVLDAYICDDTVTQWEICRAHEAIAEHRALT